MVNDLAPANETDEAIFALRLSGRSERSVAKQFKVTPRHVKDVVVRLSPRIDPDTRREELLLELGRLDRVCETFYGLALEGDPVAASILIKISERRSSLWAWDFAPRRDITVTVEQAPRPNSTQQIHDALSRLAAEKPRSQPEPEPAIEGEIIEPEPAP